MEKVCAYSECGVTFMAKTHNQRYHSSECCRQATNNRIMQDYYDKKARRTGAVRYCAGAGCKTVLSRYNDDKLCGACETAQETAARKAILRMFSGAI